MNLEKGGHVYVQQRMFQAPHGLLNHIPDGLGHLWKVAPNWKTSREGKGTVQRVLSLKGGLEAKASLSEHRALFCPSHSLLGTPHRKSTTLSRYSLGAVSVKPKIGIFIPPFCSMTFLQKNDEN